MARASQGKWFADFVVSVSAGYRSVDAVNMAAGPAYSAGQLLQITGGNAVPAGTAVAATHILMRAVEVRTGATNPVLVLARDAEVNDAYFVGPTGAYTGLAGANIIVRPGVLPTSIVTPSVEGDPGTETAGGPPEPVAA